jgi:hypothetical protein
MYVLLIIGIALMIFGGLVLVKFPDKPGGRIKWRGVEISSTGAGLPLIVLSAMMMMLAPIWSEEKPRDPPPMREGVLVGRSENRVAVAIAIKGDRAAGYLCDGNKTEAWLEGTVTGDQLDLRGKKGAALTGVLFRDVTFTFGRVTINSQQTQYRAELAQKPAGLYESRVDGFTNRIGWIVLPDGSQVGIRNVNGERSPAPKLDLNQLKVDGLQIPVTPIDGGADVVQGQ